MHLCIKGTGLNSIEERTELVDEPQEEGQGGARRKSLVIRRPPSLTAIRKERELRHGEQAPADLGHAPLSVSGNIVEHAQARLGIGKKEEAVGAERGGRPISFDYVNSAVHTHYRPKPAA